ncbi:hypothetical protein EI94DRAFT_1720038 [Lactarius quietus]|nr:hypothetical protein EI94DRAFT_1720038 [Lactarius quietus]
MSYLVTLVVSFLVILSVASPLEPPAARQMSESNHKFNQVPGSSSNSSSGCNSVPNFTINNVQQLVLGASNPDPNVSLNLLMVITLLCSTKQYAEFGVFADSFNLTNGGMYALASNGSVGGTSDTVPSQNAMLQFSVPMNASNISVPAGSFCDVSAGASTNLTMNGDGNKFALCDDSYSSAILVVYNPVEANSTDAGFDWETCVAVNITIIPVTH